MNNNLTGIKIIKITKVDPNFILSDSIQQKTYLYKVKVGQNTSFNDYHHTVVKKLDHKKMKKASK
ncbi:MAG: hypothetical protein DRP42_03410 [Tenericutes bacterium]|nr:MAG: hypothetical protein DRP42_03410 [Mycoplasmatota bacterium]